MEEVRRDKAYHHPTYEIARIYAFGGKSVGSFEWLRITVNKGLPMLPLFTRHSFLDPIRKDPAFIQFMTEMKTRLQEYRREFRSGGTGVMFDRMARGGACVPIGQIQRLPSRLAHSPDWIKLAQ